MIGHMTFGESIDLLQMIEAKHDLLQHRLDGWSAWCALRFPIQLALVQRGTVPVSRVPHHARLRLLGREALPLIRLRRARHVVKTFSSGLVEREGTRYKDVWFDDLIREIGSAFKIEQVNSPMFLPRRASAAVPSDLTTSGIEFLASVLLRTWRPRRVSLVAGEIVRVLQQEIGSDAFAGEWVERRLRHFLVLKGLYLRLFGRIRPSYLLVADPGEQASIAAAKEAGATAIELQHGGTTDRFHSGYSWTRYAIPHRNHMPIPDRLFLFGEHTRCEIDQHGFWGDAIRVVGCPRVDQYRSRRTGPAAAIPTILLTTGASVEETVAFVAEFLRAMPRRELRLVVKLHPVYERGPEAYEAAFGEDDRVQVILGSEDPSTFELLTQANLHLSVSSSCHYDSLGVGVPTVILGLPTHEIVMPLHEAGHALLARTPADLGGIVGGWRGLQVPEVVSSHYFRPGAIANMKEELASG